MTTRALLLFSLLAAPALPQDRAAGLNPRAFLPPDYRGEVFVDFETLREIEVWGAVRRSLLAPMLGMFENEYGFALDDVDRLRLAATFPAERSDARQIMSFEGNDAVGMPAFVDAGGRTAEEATIGGHEAIVMSHPSRRSGLIYYSPKPGVLVHGDDPLIRPVLEGTRKGGVPDAELQSLAAGRGVLAYAVFGLNDWMREDLPTFMDGLLVEDDPLTYVMVRLRQIRGQGEAADPAGEEPEPRIVAEIVLRCAEGREGPARIVQKVEQGLLDLQKDPRLGALKRYWKNIVVARDGTDVSLSLDLGTPRQAGATMPMLIAPMMLTTGVEEAVPAQAPPAPVKPPKGGKKKRE